MTQRSTPPIRPPLRAPMRLLGAALLGALALGLGGTAPAVADDTAAIDHAVPTEGAVRLLVSVPGADAVDLEGVRARIGGEEVEVKASTASSTTEVERTSILAIDTSASMSGARIAEAKKAANAYLATVPANVKVGVVSFDDTVQVVVPPGLDREAAASAIAGLRLTQQTALYDGVLGALKAAGPAGEGAGQRKILVLSDGKDTTDTELRDVVEAIKGSGAIVDVVSLQEGDEANQPLRSIAAAGKGTVLTTTDPAALTAAFAKEADVLARQLVVTAELPAGFEGTSSNVEVTVPVADETFTAAAYVPVKSASKDAAGATDAPPQRVDAGLLDMTTAVMYAGVGAIGLGLLGIVVLLAFGSSKTPTQVKLSEQVKAYGVTSAPRGADALKQTPQQAFGGQARQAAEKALSNNKDLEARIAAKLDSAGMALRPSEWLLMRAAIAVVGGLLGLLLGAGSLVLGVLLVVAGLVGPGIYLKVKRSKRLAGFSSGLADTLQLMSGSLSAGLSLAQSIDTIVREGTEPISGEFRRVVVESRLGVTLEDSLEGVAERMDSRDFEWVVMAIRIQREVGGNLAELLLTVAATLRERDYLRRHVRALSAEGRLSCWILGGLPPAFLGYLALSRGDYVAPMFTTPIGWLMCVGMTILLGVGVLWMSKVATVDV